MKRKQEKKMFSFQPHVIGCGNLPISHSTYGRERGITFVQDTYFTSSTGYSSYFILFERVSGQRE